MKYLKMMSVLILALTMVNCSDDDIPAPVADFTFDNTNGKKVTFSSQMSDVKSFTWNFDDGKTSTDANPVHTYDNVGDYKVTLNITGKDGSISAVVHDVAVYESTEYLLTGGVDVDGKTWKLKTFDNEEYAFGLVENNLTTIINSPYADLLESIGLAAAKGDSFTFYYDKDNEGSGAYMADNEDGQSLMTLLYASLNHFADIKAVSTDEDIPLADVTYDIPDQTNAKWSTNYDDFTVNAINFLSEQPEQVTFTDKTQLIIDGSYFGIKDASAYIIIKNIDNDSMDIAMSINLAEALPSAPVIMFHMTLLAVN